MCQAFYFKQIKWAVTYMLNILALFYFNILISKMTSKYIVLALKLISKAYYNTVIPMYPA